MYSRKGKITYYFKKKFLFLFTNAKKFIARYPYILAIIFINILMLIWR